jgi:hypothetical protein
MYMSETVLSFTFNPKNPKEDPTFDPTVGKYIIDVDGNKYKITMKEVDSKYHMNFIAEGLTKSALGISVNELKIEKEGAHDKTVKLYNADKPDTEKQKYSRVNFVTLNYSAVKVDITVDTNNLREIKVKKIQIGDKEFVEDEALKAATNAEIQPFITYIAPWENKQEGGKRRKMSRKINKKSKSRKTRGCRKSHR